MKYLIDPHGYFEERTSISFFKGLVAVFLTGGFSFLITISSIVWLLPVSAGSFVTLIREMGSYAFAYMFFNAFVWWAAIALILYVTVKIYGVGISYFDSLTVTGLGFVPILFGVFVELAITWYYLFSIAPEPGGLSSHIVLSGQFGMVPAAAVLGIRTVTLLWAGNIWLAGAHQMGRITPIKAIMTTILSMLVIWVELVGISIL